MVSSQDKYTSRCFQWQPRYEKYLFVNLHLYHLVVITVFVVLSSYEIYLLLSPTCWQLPSGIMCQCMSVIVLILEIVRVCDCIYKPMPSCVCVCVCKHGQGSLFQIERAIFCFFFQVYIVTTMSLSALNLTIFASRSRDDLTVWMLFLLKLQVSTKTMVTQLQIILSRNLFIFLWFTYYHRFYLPFC